MLNLHFLGKSVSSTFNGFSHHEEFSTFSNFITYYIHSLFFTDMLEVKNDRENYLSNYKGQTWLTGWLSDWLADWTKGQRTGSWIDSEMSKNWCKKAWKIKRLPANTDRECYTTEYIFIPIFAPYFP